MRKALLGFSAVLLVAGIWKFLEPAGAAAPQAVMQSGPVREQGFTLLVTGGRDLRATVEGGELDSTDKYRDDGLLLSGRGAGATVRFGAAGFRVSGLPLGRAVESGGLRAMLLPDAMHLGVQFREDDFPSIAAARDGAVYATFASYHDRWDDIEFRIFRGGRWSNALPLPQNSGDVWMPQVAIAAGQDAAQDRPWVVFSAQVDGNWDLYARPWEGDRWGKLERLTDNPLPDIFHRVIADRRGNLWVAWQSFRGGNSHIFLKPFQNGRWGAEIQVSDGTGNDWEPSLGADSRGAIWVAWDSYRNGNYDVFLTSVNPGARQAGMPAPLTVASTPRFEARPTVAVDAKDRVWVAYEQGNANWGKDQGYTVRGTQTGVPLGGARDIEVRVLEGSQLRAPASPVREAVPQGARQQILQPNLAVDAAGHPWLLFHARHQRAPAGAGPAQQGYWEYYATRYEGRAWTPAFPLPHSWGRNSTRTSAALAPDGRLWLAWPTDSRQFAYPHRPIKDTVYAAAITPPAGSGEITLAMLPSEARDPRAGGVSGHKDEPGDLRAIRAYRALVGGRPLSIVRGDLHRHTEFSWDGGGGNDGSLLDFYRYMIDAASMDFGASTDHQGGGHFDYWWWFTEKMTDLHHAPGRYVPLYGYERSVVFPNGHRNIFHAVRGIRVVPFFMKPLEGFGLPPGPQGEMPGVGTGNVVENDTKLLYDSIRKTKGLAISHTSATRMGTDWRDNDPELEPVVEIFQGARTNYEYAGAPRSADPERDKQHIERAGYFPDGFVWNAWAKGYKLGIITSSDHGSTHISYALVYTEKPTRQGVLDAIRKRRTYGATDNIVLDVRMGTHFMGEEFATPAPLPLRIKIRGTTPVAKVEVVRDRDIVYTATPKTQDVTLTYRDNGSLKGRHYYYVRVEQSDGQLAWSSPFWVTYP